MSISLDRHRPPPPSLRGGRPPPSPALNILDLKHAGCRHCLLPLHGVAQTASLHVIRESHTFSFVTTGGGSTGLYFPPSMRREPSVQLGGEEGMIGGFLANNELTWRRRSRGHSFVLAFIWREKLLPAAVRGDVLCLNESSQPLITAPGQNCPPPRPKEACRDPSELRLYLPRLVRGTLARFRRRVSNKYFTFTPKLNLISS